MDELNDKQGKNKEKAKMVVTTWGPNNVRSPGLNLQLIKEFLMILANSKNLLKFNKNEKK